MKKGKTIFIVLCVILICILGIAMFRIQKNKGEQIEEVEKEETSDGDESNNDAVSIEDLYGKWTLDVDKTHDMNNTTLSSQYGPQGISYGYGLEINSDNTMKFYIAVGYDGEGTYRFSGDTLHADLMGSNRQQEYDIEVVNDGQIYLVMYHYPGDYNLCWVKE